MSIATTALRHGWFIVAGAILAGGTTIYVADSVQRRITQQDAVEVIMGTVERCLATQTSTNPTYAVDPPSFVRNWVSTNGATGTNFAWVTNQVTNTISWYTDRAMMVDLDAKIVALCPYYVDTNSVYDGTTNIVMCTFTGLLTSLDLGDHTNFTSIPAIGTNSATFGPWAWRNYRVAWEERYKVLHALKMTSPILSGVSTGFYDVPLVGEYESWNDAKTHSELNFTNDAFYSGTEFQCFTAGYFATNYPIYMSWIRTFRLFAPNLSLSSNILHDVYFYAKPILPELPETLSETNGVFDDNGLGVTLNTWGLITNFPFGLPEGTAPTWCAEPTVLSGAGLLNGYPGFVERRGFIIKADNRKNIVDWQFNYCTNKYW